MPAYLARCCLGVHRRDAGRGARAAAAARAAANRSSRATESGWAATGCGCRAMRMPHTGVIEREEILRELRGQVELACGEVKELERAWRAPASGSASTKTGASAARPNVNRLHREHVDRRAELDSAKARTADAARRWSSSRPGLPTCAASSRAPKRSCAPRAAAWKPPSTRWWRSSRSAWNSSSERERMRTELGERAPRPGGATACTRTGAAGGVAALLARLADHHGGAGWRSSSRSCTRARLNCSRQIADGEAPLAAAAGAARAGAAAARANRGGAAGGQDRQR